MRCLSMILHDISTRAIQSTLSSSQQYKPIQKKKKSCGARPHHPIRAPSLRFLLYSYLRSSLFLPTDDTVWCLSIDPSHHTTSQNPSGQTLPSDGPYFTPRNYPCNFGSMGWCLELDSSRSTVTRLSQFKWLRQHAVVG